MEAPKSFFDARVRARVRGLDVREPALEGDDDNGGMAGLGAGGKVVFELDGTGESTGEYSCLGASSVMTV